MSSGEIQKAVESVNQTTIAAQLKVSRSYINMVLNRKRFPSLPVAARLSKVLGVPLDDLVKAYHWDQEPV